VNLRDPEPLCTGACPTPLWQQDRTAKWTARFEPKWIPIAVGCYIVAAYWFTASTSFANPAVTLARAFTNTFSGIRPIDAPGFVLMQLAGAAAATALFRWLTPSLVPERES